MCFLCNILMVRLFCYYILVLFDWNSLFLSSFSFLRYLVTCSSNTYTFFLFIFSFIFVFFPISLSFTLFYSHSCSNLGLNWISFIFIFPFLLLLLLLLFFGGRKRNIVLFTLLLKFRPKLGKFHFYSSFSSSSFFFSKVEKDYYI